jgi:hypothetical protein
MLVSLWGGNSQDFLYELKCLPMLKRSSPVPFTRLTICGTCKLASRGIPTRSFLGAWLTTEETGLLVKDFLTRRPRIGKWLEEPRPEFSHHKTPIDLWKASDNGCPLCHLITKCQIDQSEPQTDEEVEIGPLIFRLVSHDQYTGLYCKGEGWNLSAEFDIYMVGDLARQKDPNVGGVSEISEIWKSRQHLSDHTLSENSIKIMNGWVQSV